MGWHDVITHWEMNKVDEGVCEITQENKAKDYDSFIIINIELNLNSSGYC